MKENAVSEAVEASDEVFTSYLYASRHPGGQLNKGHENAQYTKMEHVDSRHLLHFCSALAADKRARLSPL
jgi:hypothetical protein